MTKRIFLYGFAFGSLLALSTFIYFENQLYKDFLQDTLGGKILPIIIQMVGVGLAIVAVKKSEGNYITMARAGFVGLMISIVMGIFSSFFYYVYTNQKPEKLLALKDAYKYRTAQVYEKPENKGKISEKDFNEKIKAIDYYYVPSQQMKLEMFRIMSVALIAAGAFGFMLKREPTIKP